MNRRTFLAAIGLAPAAAKAVPAKKPAVKTSGSSTMSNAELRAEMDQRHALRGKAMRQLGLTHGSMAHHGSLFLDPLQ